MRSRSLCSATVKIAGLRTHLSPVSYVVSLPKMLTLRYGYSRVIERTIFMWDNMAWTDLALTPSRDQHGQGTFWCKCTQAIWHDSPPRPARSILATCIFPCCLQPSCAADKMHRVNKMIVGTTRTQRFVRGK